MNGVVVLVTELGSAFGVTGDHDGLSVADIRHPDAVETTLGDIHRSGEVAVVTCSTDAFETVRRLVSFAQVRYPGLRATIEPIEGPPLALSVVSALVDDVHGEDDTLAWRLNALDALRADVWSAVWLPKVAGLTHPAPGLGQHVRSWLPGSGFLAVHTPEPRVLTATKAPLAGLGPHRSHALMHAAGESAPKWVVDAVRAGLEASSASSIQPVRDQIDAFGTSAAVELVAVPTSFHDDSRPRSVTECPACGVRHARATCPACGMATRTLEPLTTTPPGDAR